MDYFDPFAVEFCITGALALAVVTVVTLVGVELLESSVEWLTRGVHTREED